MDEDFSEKEIDLIDSLIEKSLKEGFIPIEDAIKEADEKYPN